MNDIFTDKVDNDNIDNSIDEGWSQCGDFDDGINFDNYRGE